MELSEELVSQVRRDLAGLLGRPEVAGDFKALAEERDPAERRRRAFALATQHVGIRSLGELASRTGDARDDLLRLAVEAEDERELVRGWLVFATRPAVFRAFAHALPFSFRAEPSPSLAAHVESLRKALDAPIWPDVPVSLAQIFVPLAARVVEVPARAAGAVARAKVRSESAPVDALTKIREMLSEPDRRSLSVKGPPGVGKSSLAAVIAGREARAWGYVPVLLRAPELLPVRGNEAPPVEAMLSELGATGPLLLIVDGVDELTSPLVRGDVIARVAALLRDAEDARALLFGRELRTLAEGREECLELLPFDRDRSRAWSAAWEAATGKDFDIDRFIEEPVGDEPEGAPTDIFTEYPLTLFVLAVAERTGRRLPTTRTERGRAALYRVVLDKLAGLSKTEGAREHRAVMRAAAVLSHTSPRLAVDPSLIHEWFTGSPGPRRAVTVADRVSQSFTRFPMTRDAAGVRFVHASIRDHLAAEQLAASAWRLLAFTGDEGDRAVTSYAEESALAAAWVGAFGRFPIDAYTLAPLQQMLPDWPAYESGGKSKSSERKRLCAKLSAVLLAAYRWLVEDLAAESVIAEARAWGVRPRRVAATALFNVFAVARCVDHPAPSWFAPDRVVPGSLATAWYLVAAELDLTDGMRELMLERLVLQGLSASSVKRLALEPIDLRDEDLSSPLSPSGS